MISWQYHWQKETPQTVFYLSPALRWRTLSENPYHIHKNPLRTGTLKIQSQAEALTETQRDTAIR